MQCVLFDDVVHDVELKKIQKEKKKKHKKER